MDVLVPMMNKWHCMTPTRSWEWVIFLIDHGEALDMYVVWGNTRWIWWRAMVYIMIRMHEWCNKDLLLLLSLIIPYTIPFQLLFIIKSPLIGLDPKSDNPSFGSWTQGGLHQGVHWTQERERKLHYKHRDNLETKNTHELYKAKRQGLSKYEW